MLSPHSYFQHHLAQLDSDGLYAFYDQIVVEDLNAIATKKTKVGVGKGEKVLIYQRTIQHDGVITGTPTGDSPWALNEGGQLLQRNLLPDISPAGASGQRYTDSTLRVYENDVAYALGVSGDTGLALADISGKLYVRFLVARRINPKNPTK